MHAFVMLTQQADIYAAAWNQLTPKIVHVTYDQPQTLETAMHALQHTQNAVWCMRTGHRYYWPRLLLVQFYSNITFTTPYYIHDKRLEAVGFYRTNHINSRRDIFVYTLTISTSHRSSSAYVLIACIRYIWNVDNDLFSERSIIDRLMCYYIWAWQARKDADVHSVKIGFYTWSAFYQFVT